jgi:hypothetical protein
MLNPRAISDGFPARISHLTQSPGNFSGASQEQESHLPSDVLKKERAPITPAMERAASRRDQCRSPMVLARAGLVIVPYCFGFSRREYIGFAPSDE